MKHLYIISFFLISSLTNGQSIFEQENLATEIVEALETTQAVKALVSNKKTIKGQLEDIKAWTIQKKISEEHYLRLRASYQNYAGTMNSIVNKLGEDLLSLKSTRQLKSVKLDKFIKKFNLKYGANLQEAYLIYTNEFYPTLSTVQANANTKTGIIPTIVLVVKFGETLFTTFKNLFSKNKNNGIQEADLIQMAMGLGLPTLKSSLQYPSWEEVVPSFNTAAPLANTNASPAIGNSIYPMAQKSGLQLDQNLELVAHSIQLSSFITNIDFSLSATHKSISVGGQSPKNAPIFTLDNPLSNGDRFWVKLSGFEYANFFYFDEYSNSWQDPFGKSIVVGSQLEQGVAAVKYLPSKSSYFEIGGTSQMEQFLIVVSKAPMPTRIRDLIIGETKTGGDMIEAIANWLPNTMVNITDSQQPTSTTYVDLKAIDAQTQYVPVYIVIPKTQPNN